MVGQQEGLEASLPRPSLCMAFSNVRYGIATANGPNGVDKERP